MPQYTVDPVLKSAEEIRSLASWSERQLTRLVNQLNAENVIYGEILSVTGTEEIETEVPYVLFATASLVYPPVAGAAYVTCGPISSYEERGTDFDVVQVSVWTSAFALSTTPTDVQVIAFGQLQET